MYHVLMLMNSRVSLGPLLFAEPLGDELLRVRVEFWIHVDPGSIHVDLVLRPDGDLGMVWYGFISGNWLHSAVYKFSTRGYPGTA